MPARVVLICDRCKRRGEYDRDRLMERHGDVALPGLLEHLVAERRPCLVAARTAITLERCEARFVD